MSCAINLQATLQPIEFNVWIVWLYMIPTVWDALCADATALLMALESVVAVAVAVATATAITGTSSTVCHYGTQRGEEQHEHRLSIG